MRLEQVDLNKLHTFFAVAEHGGVTAAARRLALTPSAVSQSLSGLESALDVKLFNRVGRSLVLTREGQLLYTRFRDYQSRLRETLDEIVDQDREPRGLVRLGLSLGFPRLRLAKFLGKLSRENPELTFKVLYESHDELNAGLLESRLDFVFSIDRAGEGRRIQSTRLFEQELVLVAGKRHYRPRFDADALRTIPVIDYYQSDSLIQRWATHHFRRKPPRPRVRIWAATTDLVLDLVLDGAGIAVLPRHLVRPYLERGRLLAIETGRSELRDFIWLKELRGAYRGPALAAFRSVAVREFGSLSS